MGPVFVLLAVAGAAIFAARPMDDSRAYRAAASPSHSARALAAAERDFAKRQGELGLVGAAPLFGAEGLPKPAAR